ncbi:amino acid adenylation domain-containing protein [Nostoc sp.]|uniref:amino acid adenylation domain-containing protein n=1 Tax=Nostoc sp. TaxID=1180 RepID=UPI002FF82076
MDNTKDKILKRRSKLSPTQQALLEKRLRGEVDSHSQLEVIPKRSQTSPAPLSFAQQRLWFLHQLDPSNPYYSELASIQLLGALNVDVLEQSLNKIVQRHEALRTTFEIVEEQAVQVIHPTVTVTLPLVNLLLMPEVERQAQVERLTTEIAQKSFDLASRPLLRVMLLQIGVEEYLLLFAIHHIAVDGWSIKVLIRELAALYETFSISKTFPLPDLPIQYADFAIWQRQWLQKELQKTQLDYWKQQLADASTLALPTDRPRPAVQSFRGAVASFELSVSLTDMLRDLSNQENVTLFMTLLAAFQALLYRYTGQEDICVGSPIANRNRSEIQGLIGFFVNTLVLRTHVSGNPSFLELLNRVREVCVGAYAHADIPFEKLVEEIQPDRNLSHMPLFQVMFALHEDTQKELTLPGLTLNWLPTHSKTARFDLTLHIVNAEPELRGLLEYNTDLFDAETITRIVEHFRTLLEGIVANPQARLSDLPLLTADELYQQLVEWNDTKVEYPQQQCIHQLFEAQVERTPDAVAVVFEDEQLTYCELNARANQLAHYLQQLGVKPEILVGICVERSLSMIIGLLAIFKAGGAYIPLDLAYPLERLAFILQDAAVSVLLTQQHLIKNLPKNQTKIVCLDTDWQSVAQQSSQNPISKCITDNLAYIIYTSGSTGQPKGALVNHRNVIRLFAATESWYKFNQHDVWTLFHSIAFDFSVWEIWGALLYGGQLVIVPYLLSRSPEDFYKLLLTQQVTILNQTPSAFHQLIQVEESLVNSNNLSLRKVIFGGEALQLESLRPWFERHGDEFPQLINMYGITETTVHVTYRPLTMADLEVTLASIIGRPISDLQVYLLDQYRQPVPIGVPGEMYIGGAGVVRGYLNRPTLTPQKFIPNRFSDKPNARLYKSGDLARYLPNGEIEYIGRIDNQVKVRGFRIELGEIEALLSQHPAAGETVVVVHEDSADSQRIVAYVVAQKEQTPTTSELRAFLESKLPNYMVPKAFVILEALPLTPNGKVDRKALPLPDRIRPELEKALIAPQTNVEKQLAVIWAQVLGLEKIGINDNFFELGGDSILSLQVISKANQVGLHLTPKQLFQHQTIAKLAVVASTTKEIQAEQNLVTGLLELTPIQQWFFEQEQAQPHHWNQAVLLEVKQRINPVALEKVVQFLQKHHDVLRSRFPKEESGLKAVIVSPDHQVPLTYLDLSALPKNQQLAQIEAMSTQLQASLNLTQGPLWRVALFDFGDKQPSRLLWVIHHLVVDGVSWRILLEDFQTAYQQICEQKVLQLPAKTTSFKQWSICLQEYAQLPELSSQLEYWLTTKHQLVKPIPRDFSYANNLEESACSVAVSLSVEETQVLLQQVPAVYQTQINDVLLTALVQTFAQWTGETSLLIDLEGHGREELFEDVDLSRTVGWFTTIFPIHLSLESTSNPPGKALKSIKEQLRAIPNRGIGYGVLRYLSADKGVSEFSYLPKAEVVFNYLGQFDQVLPTSSLFRFATESSGASLSLQSKRTHLLEINSSISQGYLQINWTYSNKLHRQTTVETLAQQFIEAVRSLIAHCQSADAGGFTPSDFAEFKQSQWDQTDLDAITAAIREKNKNIEDFYPLSPMQQGILYHSLAALKSGIYFEQFSWTLQGKLNVTAFHRAWQYVVERHAILRTCFVWEGLKEPVQIVHRQVVLPWQEYNWQHLSSDEQQQKLEVLLQSDRFSGFELTHLPLIHLTLVQFSDISYNFTWSHHHLLLDGWSVALVFKEVLACYKAFSNGEDVYLEPIRPYRDYIVWLQQQNLSAAETFWRQMLKGFTTPTRLWADQKAKKSLTPQDDYNEQKIQLSAVTTAALQSIAQQHQLTLNTLVQGAWALLLSHYSSQSDIVFGAVASGRPPTLAQAESMVGLFINTLPVRVKVSPKEFLLPWLQKIQTQLVEARQYEYSPLVKIQGWSEVPKGLALFESIVVFENYPVDASVQQRNVNFEIEDFYGFERTNYPITLTVNPGKELLLKITYDNSDRFDTITRMLGHLQTLLEGMATNPQQRLWELPLLTETERHQLLVEWNDTEVEYPQQKCIHQLFEAQVERTPDAVAVVFEDEQLTYCELNARANQLAHYLQQLGVKPEILVGICVERSLFMVIGLLAILKAGGAYVPLDPSYPQERLAFILEDTQATVLLTTTSLLKTILQYKAKLVCLDTDWQEIVQQSQENLFSQITTNNLAYVIYTSGSTGRPKGVMIKHASTVAMLDWANKTYTIEAREGVLASTSICFDLSVFEVFVPLSCGGKVILIENALLLPTLPASFGVTLINTVPSVISQLVRTNSIPTSVQTVNIAGEPLHNQLVQQLYKQDNIQQVFNLYGPSEDTTYSTSCWIYKGATNTPPIGRPIHNTQTYLLDENLQPVPVGVPGILYVSGAGLARGYLNKAEFTADKFIPNPYAKQPGEQLYKTGDKARYLPNGEIEYIGRIDNQVKVRGFRIELGEIEALLSQHPAAGETVVVVHEDSADSQRIVAYVVAQKEQTPTTSELRAFLESKLPNYMVPKAFVILEALPLTPNGKVDRKALPLPDRIRPELEKALIAPQTNVEKQLAVIWAQVLGLEKIGINDNFFELGGDSILSLQVISKANQVGLHLTPKQLFQHQTIAKLAVVASTTKEIQAEQNLVTGLLELTPIQQWFFEQEQAQPHHWNQAVLLEVKQRINPVALEKVVQFLQKHHDVLRSRFPKEESGLKAVIVSPDHQVPLTYLDLSALPKNQQLAQIEAMSTQLQASLNLTQGPLWRVALFDFGDKQPSRLLWVIHHLVVDGVSWRILLEDFQTAYQQICEQKALQLPAKTTSFQQWSVRLLEYAQSKNLPLQLNYWLTNLTQQVESIPQDYPGTNNTEATATTVSVSLGVKDTQALLQDVPAVYRTQINDLLLTALVQAFAQWTGQSSLLVDLEGHGREQLFENLEISRTVGWFTSIFPVYLKLENASQSQPKEALKTIKEQLRRIPNRGIDYGILRYLSSDQEIAQQLSQLPSAQVSFNYLGQFDQLFSESSLLSFADESSGISRSLLAKRSHLLEIDSMIAQGQLQINWTYSNQIHCRATVEALAQGFIQALQSLIACCQSPEAGGFTPSDFVEFQQSQWDQADLDAITAAIGGT